MSVLTSWNKRCHQFDTHDISVFRRFCWLMLLIPSIYQYTRLVLAICTHFARKCTSFHGILAPIDPHFSGTVTSSAQEKRKRLDKELQDQAEVGKQLGFPKLRDWDHSDMEVSINGRTPKWMVCGKIPFNRWFRGSPTYGNHHILHLQCLSADRYEIPRYFPYISQIWLTLNRNGSNIMSTLG